MQKSKVKTKMCPKCNCTKPLIEFSKNATRPDGYQTYCKSCQRELDAMRYQRNKQESTKSINERIQFKSRSIGIKNSLSNTTNENNNENNTDSNTNSQNSNTVENIDTQSKLLIEKYLTELTNGKSSIFDDIILETKVKLTILDHIQSIQMRNASKCR